MNKMAKTPDQQERSGTNWSENIGNLRVPWYNRNKQHRAQGEWRQNHPEPSGASKHFPCSPGYYTLNHMEYWKYQLVMNVSEIFSVIMCPCTTRNICHNHSVCCTFEKKIEVYRLWLCWDYFSSLDISWKPFLIKSVWAFDAVHFMLSTFLFRNEVCEYTR